MDCGFLNGDEWFRYRACGIIVEDGCVLFVSDDGFEYIYSVGGGVHHCETSADAAVREVYEETGARYEIDRLAVVHENFWNEGDGAGGIRKCHELAFYYMMKPRGTRELPGGESKHNFHWVPIEELGSVKSFPTFLNDYFKRGHSGIELIVADERTEV